MALRSGGIKPPRNRYPAPRTAPSGAKKGVKGRMLRAKRGITSQAFAARRMQPSSCVQPYSRTKASALNKKGRESPPVPSFEEAPPLKSSILAPSLADAPETARARATHDRPHTAQATCHHQTKQKAEKARKRAEREQLAEQWRRMYAVTSKARMYCRLASAATRILTKLAPRRDNGPNWKASSTKRDDANRSYRWPRLHRCAIAVVSARRGTLAC